MEDNSNHGAHAPLLNESGGHHHRRISSVTPRRAIRRENTNEVAIASGSEDEVLASPASANDILEMDDINSDEETGLTAKERRRNTLQPRYHSHDDREGPLSSYEKRLADRDVLKQLIINAMLIGSWYLFATSISVYNKWMFSPDRLNFHFPLFTTSLHMLVQFSLASVILYAFPSLRPANQTSSYTHSHSHHHSSEPSSSDPPSKSTVTHTFYVTRLLPCGIATALDIGLGNTSLKFISLTFLTMCKSSSLAFVLIFAFIFRLETPSWKLILIITTMTIGVVMMVAGESAFNLIGFTLIISSAFFSGFRWALTQILLLRHPVTANPFSTLFFISPIMFVSLFLIASVAEGPTAVAQGLHDLVTKEGIFPGICLLIFPGILAFCMISSEFALLQRTNVVTLSICGIFKEVVTISAAEFVYEDPLTPINLSGLAVTIASIAGYNYLKVVKMRADALEKLEQERLGRGGDGVVADADDETGEGGEGQSLIHHPDDDIVGQSHRQT